MGRFGSEAPVRIAPNRSFVEALPSPHAECATPTVKQSYVRVDQDRTAGNRRRGRSPSLTPTERCMQTR